MKSLKTYQQNLKIDPKTKNREPENKTREKCLYFLVPFKSLAAEICTSCN